LPAQALAEVPIGQRRADWEKIAEAVAGNRVPQECLRNGAARSWCTHSRHLTLRSSIRELDTVFTNFLLITAMRWGQPLHLDTPS
jgi:hypothetical protein